MSYRVDIPTLSANEVYTLTFEYEGTETIQLIVGDLTLETTDRRVVFTTTSPVYYIESNVNLTNLNIYEGYYESDDFGGEYTQESYLSGGSLINIMTPSSPKTLSQGWSLDFDETTGVTTIIFDNNTNNFACSMRSFDMMKKLKPATYYTYFVEILENSLVDSSGNKPNITFYNTASYLYPSTQCPYNAETAKGDCVGGSGTERQTIKNEASPGKYVWAIKTVDTFVDTMVDADKIFQTAALNGTIKVKMMIIEGDYVDNPIETNWFPQGIGCVKSPKIVSHKAKNLVPAFEITSGYGSNVKIEVFDDNKHIEFAHTGNDARLQFRFDVTSIGLTSGDLLGIEFDAITKGTGTVANRTSAHLVFTNIKNIDDKTSMNYFETGHYKNVVEIVGNPIQIHFRQNVSGANGNEYFIVKNFSVFKINSVDDMKDNYEECVVSTPDDLELYSLPDGTCDILDLTTGVVTRNTEFYKYTGTWGDAEECTVSGYDDGNWWYTRISTGFATSKNTMILLHGIVFYQFHGITGQTYLLVPKSLVTNASDMITWLRNNIFALLKKQTPTTEQLSLNPLKSYKNGSIQTSSQQLTPTLKTTLPVSNKFTTTNLTSGSTYNVYFNGTATQIDAGGTIITNPISPCEVECGGTTLTIEGTDIQNVRVLETTNINEVGSVNETTDVELKKMKTCKYENILDDIKYSTTVSNGTVININYDDFCIEFMGAHEWAANSADTGLKYPTGCSLVHVEFDIDMDKPNLRMAINFNEGIRNNYPQHRHVTLNNDTATIAQGNYDNIYTSIITKGHFSRLMYADGDRPIIINLYTGGNIAGILATGNSAEGSINGYETMGSNYGRITNLRMRIIENFSSNYTTVTSVLRDSSYNIIWQDMDMTMPVTTSNLEQPIKLRSLETTYDSYNPVTGELIKRIGVSETDGSYSVLSSPIVIPPKYKMLQDNNIMPNSFPQQMNSGYVDFLPTQLLPNTTYTVFLDATTAVGQLECGLLYNADWYDGVKSFTVGVNRFIYTTGNDINGYYSNTSHRGFRIRGQGSIINNLIMVQGEYSLDFYNPINVPHLYTNGQVKVYSDSEVYPTTILNGQSTNNYEINELNTSNNYTIRYEGECESINLANKSNEQGTNRIVKSGTTSGNLTFVNNGGDIDNVLLTQGDVREQEINHFNGLQTVEISKMIVQSPISKHLFYNHGLNDFVPRVNTNYSFDENNNLVLSNGYGNNVDTMLQTVDKYTLEKGDSVIFRVVGIGNIGADHRLLVKLATQNSAFGGYYADSYVNFKAPKVQEIINEQGYCDVVYTYNGETTTDNIEISNYFGKWIISSVVLCKQSQEIITPIIIDLPQPVQLNSLPDGTCDTYNPITGEYVQNVGTIQWDSSIVKWNKTYSFASLIGYSKLSHVEDWGNPNYKTLVNEYSMPSTLTAQNSISNNATMSREFNGGWSYWGAVDFGVGKLAIIIPREFPGGINEALQYLDENPIMVNYKRTEPTITQLTPIEIPTLEGGILQLITTDGKVFPMVEYSMPTNNRYDTSSWEAGAVYTQRNMTEAYFNESTTPMIPTETMTLTTDHISSGSIILNDNGNGLIVLKGNYTGRDIPYFTGMRSVEAIEVETTPSPEQPLFGKGGRK